MAVSIRWLRLRAVWLLVLPFLWLARPTPRLLMVGLPLAALGLAIRAWAAGVIHKNQELTMTGPYAFTRNPLYLGLIALYVGLALLWPSFWALVLTPVGIAALWWGAIAPEERYLRAKFGVEYDAYCARVRRWL